MLEGIKRRLSRTSEVRHRLSAQRHELEYQPVLTNDPREGHHHFEGEQLTWGQQVLESHTFMNVMAVIIMANGVVIGLETDIKSKYWSIVEACFLVIFLAELVLKMSVERWMYFHPNEPDFLWNMFDIVVVGLAVFDFLSSCLGLKGSGGFATIFRMARLLRILRIIRLLKFLKPLFLLAVGLIEACKAIIWVTLLMGTVLYVFAIVLVKTVGQVSPTDPHYDFLTEHFRNIPDCMITLFILMSSPNLPVYQDEGLLDSRPLFCVFLVMFICFGSFGMIAMLTGVINESMFENNEIRKQEKKMEHEVMRQSLGKHAADLYESLPLDERGCARTEDLKNIAEACAELLDQSGVTIAYGDIVRFLEFMDEEETGSIDMIEFVHAMEKMAEGLSPLALVEIQHYTALCNKKVSQQLDSIAAIEKKIASQMTKTEDEVNRILANLTSDQNNHRGHLVEKIEGQMRHMTEEVDRILQIVVKEQNEHRGQLVEKIEAQMLHITSEVDRIFNVVTGGETNVRRASLAVPTVANMAPDVQTTVSRASMAVPSVGDSARDIEILSEIRRCESTMLAAVSKQLCKQTEHVATQSLVDKKFSDFERKLALKDSSDRCVQLAVSSQLQDISASIHSLLNEALLQDLNIKDGVMESMRTDLTRLVQESKSSFVRVATAQDTVKDSVDVLTSKVSKLGGDAHSVQAQLLGSVAELGSEIINSLSHLVTTNMDKLRQDLVLPREESFRLDYDKSRYA